MIISVFGLGKLGLPFSLCMSLSNNKIIGIDLNKKLINLLKTNKYIGYEPDINNLIHKIRNNISFDTNFKSSIKKSSISFIIVPTPSKIDGSFSLKYIMKVLQYIALELKNKKSWHLIVITSTVSPLSMERVIKPYLEKISGKLCGKDFGLCYSPELIALGSVVENLTYPDFLLIGESDKKSGDLLEEIRKQICKNNPPVVRTNFINAELIKLSLNSYITTKISFANMIARLCEKLPGANVDSVTSALGLDSRIGNKFLKGGLGFGGPCFPRDNIALNHVIRSLKLDIKLPMTVDQFNKNQVKFLKKIVLKYYKKNETIGILGLSYKPNTNIIEESQSILLIKELLKENLNIVAYDPTAISNTKLVLQDSIIYASSIKDCVVQSDILIIATPWDRFKDILKLDLSKKIVIDCWRMIKGNTKNLFRYIPLGKFIK